MTFLNSVTLSEYDGKELRNPAALRRHKLAEKIEQQIKLAADPGVPPLKWSTNWDMMIPLFGGPEDGWKAREAGRHCFEASAG